MSTTCGQQSNSKIGPVIKNFTSAGGDVADSTTQLLITTEWSLDGLCHVSYDTKTKGLEDVVVLRPKSHKMPPVSKSSLVLNNNSSSSRPVVPAISVHGNNNITSNNSSINNKTYASVKAALPPASVKAEPVVKIPEPASLSPCLQNIAIPTTPTTPIDSSPRTLTWNADWVQCSGHTGVFAPSKEGTIWKKVSSNSPSAVCKKGSNSRDSALPEGNNNCKDNSSSNNNMNNEIAAYKRLMCEPGMRGFVPQFHSEITMPDGERFIEIEDLLRHFRPPTDATASSCSNSSTSTTSTAPSLTKQHTSSSPRVSSSSSSSRMSPSLLVNSTSPKSCTSIPTPVVNGSSAIQAIITGDTISLNTQNCSTGGVSSGSRSHNDDDDDCRRSNENRCIHIMDIKMGTRTFLEQEASSSTQRPDLYEKMVKVDPSAPTPAEHAAKSVTKLRYMSFRESMSSSSRLGFRIEGIQPFPIKDQIGKDFQKMRNEEDIRQVLRHFLLRSTDSDSHHLASNLKQQLITRLKQLESAFSRSQFFSEHEIIGSSLLVIHDSQRLGVWMIDFAKSLPLPPGTTVDHVSDWELGNHEDGYLFGLQNLIRLTEEL